MIAQDMHDDTVQKRNPLLGQSDAACGCREQ